MFFKTAEETLEMGEREEKKFSWDPLLPIAAVHRTFDYVLVAHKHEDDGDLKNRRAKAFIHALEKKNFSVTRIEHEEKIFYGLRAPRELFEEYMYLLKVSDSCNWTGDLRGVVAQATRIRIVHFILYNTDTTSGENLRELLVKNVFESAFCLHERKEQKSLGKKWARWSGLFSGQPLSKVSKEVCESNITMCPRCDNTCTVWQLSDTCTYAKISLLFDNEGTVAFAMFMAIWATLFLELWKRTRARHVSMWKVYDWCEEEEELILEIVNNPHSSPTPHRHSYLRSTLVLILVTLMLMIIIGLAHALVVFRVVIAPLMSEGSWDFIKDNATTVAVMLGAVLHYFTIVIMTKVNRWVALKLCHIEKTNSFASTERSFTVKMFTFQFFTLFSSLFYVAFFLGRINGHPGNYTRIATRRLEECHPSGCLTDLFIQMAVILILKQTINNIFEFTVPWVKRLINRNASRTLRRKCGHCYRKACRDEEGRVEPCDICKLRDWLRNYHLTSTDAFSLFNEFLEMGVWTQVLEAIGVLAVIANGLVIGITSDFIPRLVYRYRTGPCATGSETLNCMSGYIRDTLSIANFTHEAVSKDFTKYQMRTERGINVTECSYRDYRSSEDYSLTSQFWLVLAVRFAFVIIFEHVVVVCKFIAAWFVPNNPIQVKNDRLRDKLSRLKDELREMRRNKSTDV
ncbi:hypothetical protein WMY93_013211 [Mugilogobius chulae]|uniref:Anoctamin n=1 Tax=Mugilogobius chulae TaxID=88201 RepID=A0AAW0P317_9GOBI